MDHCSEPSVSKRVHRHVESFPSHNLCTSQKEWATANLKRRVWYLVSKSITNDFEGATYFLTAGPIWTAVQCASQKLKMQFISL